MGYRHSIGTESEMDIEIDDWADLRTCMTLSRAQGRPYKVKYERESSLSAIGGTFFTGGTKSPYTTAYGIPRSSDRDGGEFGAVLKLLREKPAIGNFLGRQK